MKPEFVSLVWGLPGARSFVHKTGQALRDGISLLCLFLSPPEADNFQDQLRQHLEQELVMIVRMLDLRRVNGHSPFEILQRLLPAEHNYQYLEQMVSDPALPAATLVTHFEGRSASEVQDWVQSLARWAEACRSSGSLNSLALLVPFEQIDQIQLPVTDVRLAYMIWPGVPSALEMHMLCRINSAETDAEAQWREYLLASIVGNDLSLAERLWEYACEPFETILEVLEQYARSRHWSPEEILGKMEQWRPIPAGSQVSPKPNTDGYNLFSRGWTVYTPEYGEEIHTAALLLIGRQQEVMHRIWRAQAALMLPMIDDIRRRICDYLTDRYGSQWALIDNVLLEPPIDLGKLKYYFDMLSPNSWEKKQWGRGVYQVWHARNELAHYRPVSYATFHAIWRLNVSVHSMMHRIE